MQYEYVIFNYKKKSRNYCTTKGVYRSWWRKSCPGLSQSSCIHNRNTIFYEYSVLYYVHTCMVAYVYYSYWEIYLTKDLVTSDRLDGVSRWEPTSKYQSPLKWRHKSRTWQKLILDVIFTRKISISSPKITVHVRVQNVRFCRSDFHVCVQRVISDEHDQVWGRTFLDYIMLEWKTRRFGRIRWLMMFLYVLRSGMDV